MTPSGIPFDTILHIGAGAGDQVAGWLALDVRRIILVEPNPAHAAALNRLAADHPEVQVIEAAIAAQDGEGQLRVFNLARHSSLHAPTGLTDLLPGLRQVATLPVKTLSPAALLARLGPVADNALLMLDAPGSEQPILQGFAGAGVLDQFAIELTCTEQALYKGAASRATLQDLLEAAGFALTAQDRSDPDWPRLSFRIDRKARLIADLTDQLQSSRTATLALETQAAVTATRVLAQAAEIADLRSLLALARRDQDRLSAELDAADTARAAQGNTIAEAEKRESTARQETAMVRSALEASLAERQASARQIAALQAQLTDVQQVQAEQDVTISRQSRMIEDARALNASRAVLIQALETAQAEAGAAQAEHTLSLETALADAQAAHATLSEEQTGLTAELAAATALAAGLGTQARELQEAMATLRGFHDSCRLRVTELDATIAELERGRFDAGANAATQSERLRHLETALAKAEADLARAARDMANLQGQMTAFETEAKTEASLTTDTLARQAERIRELEFRQTLARDELRRSEGQLDLIKDLLLRGDRL